MIHEAFLSHARTSFNGYLLLACEDILLMGSSGGLSHSSKFSLEIWNIGEDHVHMKFWQLECLVCLRMQFPKPGYVCKGRAGDEGGRWG